MIKGFTLAETLITLGIIGVVAALTIPTLIANYQEKSYKSQYKKIFSELNQALRLLEEDESSPLTLCKSMENECFRDLFSQKLKISHKCDDEIPNKCQNLSYYLDNTTIQNRIKINDKWPALMTLRGYSVKFRYHYTDCSTIEESQKEYGELSTCGWVQVDTNGLSGPNRVGKDIFLLYLMQNGFVPMLSASDTDKIHDCYKGTGISCSSLFINNGGSVGNHAK